MSKEVKQDNRDGYLLNQIVYACCVLLHSKQVLLLVLVGCIGGKLMKDTVGWSFFVRLKRTDRQTHTHTVEGIEEPGSILEV